MFVFEFPGAALFTVWVKGADFDFGCEWRGSRRFAIRGALSGLSQLVIAIAAPAPKTGIIDQASFDRIHVHVVKLL